MPQPKSARLWWLDALRGAALLNMLGYHAMYDWVYVFGRPAAWYSITAPGCHLWQQYICWSFLLIAGFSFSLSRRPLKNGLATAGCAALLTLVTVAVMPSERIWFGILHLMACALLLSCLLRPALEKIPPAAGLAVFAGLFLLTDQLPLGYLGFEGLRLAALPPALYRANWFWLGFQDIGHFYSADYFPLVPWLFLFWCGYFLYRLAAPRLAARPCRPAPAALRPLCALGSRTLLLYMLHQPVLYGALWLANRLLPAL